jgi:hypothetical protein
MTGLPAVLWNVACVVVPTGLLLLALYDRKRNGRQGRSNIALPFLGLITALMVYQFVANAVELYQLKRIPASEVIELQIQNRIVSTASDVTAITRALNDSRWYVRWTSRRTGLLPVRVRLRGGTEYEFVLRRDIASNVVVVDSTTSMTHSLSHGYAASDSLLTALKNAGFSL